MRSALASVWRLIVKELKEMENYNKRLETKEAVKLVRGSKGRRQ